jgi:hypothetical protein
MRPIVISEAASPITGTHPRKGESRSGGELGR